MTVYLPVKHSLYTRARFTVLLPVSYAVMSLQFTHNCWTLTSWHVM